jgi:hypothetical protein
MFCGYKNTQFIQHLNAPERLECGKTIPVGRMNFFECKVYGYVFSFLALRSSFEGNPLKAEQWQKLMWKEKNNPPCESQQRKLFKKLCIFVYISSLSFHSMMNTCYFTVFSSFSWLSWNILVFIILIIRILRELTCICCFNFNWLIIFIYPSIFVFAPLLDGIGRVKFCRFSFDFHMHPENFKWVPIAPASAYGSSRTLLISALRWSQPMAMHWLVLQNSK